MNLQHLIGRRVSVHYNLHRCRTGGDPVPGESCFVVKDGGMSNHVSGYAKTFILTDVTLVVQPGGLARVRAQGTRSVMAYYVGILVAVDVEVQPLNMVAIAFNPFKDNTFVRNDDRSIPIVEATCVMGDGRRTWAA